MTTAAVVLGAGGGTRFSADGHKLLAPFRGQPLVSWAVAHAMESGIGEMVVVTGAVDLADVLPPGVRTLHNGRWEEGQAGSLQTAVSWAREAALDAIVVGLGDQPLVPPAAWRAVAASASPIAVAEFEGRRCPPTRLAAEVWELLPTEGDEGARVVMASRPELVKAVACRGQAIDIDTVEDLIRWS